MAAGRGREQGRVEVGWEGDERKEEQQMYQPAGEIDRQRGVGKEGGVRQTDRQLDGWMDG